MRALQINAADNVATTTVDVRRGDAIEVMSPAGESILVTTARGDIGFGHKLAIQTLQPGDLVIKYGETIGIASQLTAIGALVHVHNVESGRLPTKGAGEGIL